MSDIVQKLWGFCHTLRHDGVDYGDYIEQITYLLFLKMADERKIEMPRGCDWRSLADTSGTALIDHYGDVLRNLGKQPGILGDIYAKSQNRFNNPVNLKRLIGLIDETHWTSLGVDVKAQAYEGLLEKAASEGKKGAGQYFTPRVLIQSIVRCMKPDPRASSDYKICDPACGSGHFPIAAAHRIAKRLASIRTGDEEPSPPAMQHALRDVIGHCVYGVDQNPMAVELCKVALWIEAMEPGKPLSFLDHRIVRGNSLLGTTPALLAGGIPDEAFTAIEGDDQLADLLADPGEEAGAAL